MTALDEFLLACAAEIGRRARLARSNRPQLGEGHLAFRRAVEAATPAAAAPSTVPVASWLTATDTSPLADSLRAAEPELAWVPSPRLGDAGTEAALAPLNAVRHLGDVTAGLLLLCPHGTYPRHSHPPQELYLPICGDGQWRYGGSEQDRRLGPDDLVYNHPNDLHRVVAGEAPLVALYVLWGDTPL